ncbi:two-component regulator propeller domain-containing protein [Rhodocytophaga aerolata]|uniref:Two-component regulator propeller domain-containing protein n=1 Tax=Rhodocytophaga aerolata TaxID=455078 RepID=A0ABT8RA34_9BACT|nr:sensor histidine kinase [Rhodocytophaga aerolata]MDO1448920.1 two-component regulator propeller domain-containing protein [Rhodocytophaga aerolata]
MVNSHWYIFFFSFILFCSGLTCNINSVFAQPKDIAFDHITIDKGLSSTSIYALAQTEDGFLWIGTQNGLNRYDGYSFKVFNYIPGTKTSLSNNWVKAICKDKHGHLWVGTSSGLNRFNRETEEFTTYFNHRYRKNSLADNNIWSMFVDREGTLWIGTNNGLSKYDEANDQFVNYYTNNGTIEETSSAINTIIEDNFGNLWVGTWGSGMFLFNKKTGIFTNFVAITQQQLAANQLVKVLKFDSKGLLWIGTQDNGLHCYDSTSRKYTIYKYDKNNSLSINDNSVLSIKEDSRNNLWFGTYSGGINLYNRNKKTFTRYQHDLFSPQSLQGEWITSFLEDMAGNIWVGHENGLSKFNPQGPKFLHYKHNPFEPNSIPNNNINVVFEDREGDVWFGTWGGGLSKFNLEKNTFTHFTHSPEDPSSIADNRIWGITEDSFGTLWIATSYGLDKIDKKTGRFLHFNQLKVASKINYMALSSMTVDQQDRLWIGTWGNGVYVYDIRKDTIFHLLHNEDDNNSLSNDRIKHIFVDSRQNIWISTSEGGLDKITLDAKQKPHFLHYRYDVSKTHGIGSDSPWIVYEDRKGKIWVGTEGGGLSYMEPSGNTFRRIQTKGAVTFPTSIYGILEDNAGNLWLSSNNGIIHYNPATGQVKGYDVTDGLQSNVFFYGHCKTKSGAMIFGGHNGFNLFYPVKITESNFTPKVYFDELRVFNELIEVGKTHKSANSGQKPLLSKPLYLCKEIRLSYKDYILSFGFTSLDFTSPNKNKYAYMLENFEDEWNYTDGKKRYATYTNLPPGEYFLKVKGTNSDGVWNTEANTLKIIITPPFWQTWWFKTLAGSILLLIAYTIHKVWVQVKLENLLALERVKAQEAEAIRKKVAMDFHDEMGNQLASITAIINMINIRQSKKEFYIEDLLSRLNQHAQTLFYGTKDFIWSIDPKSDKLEVILLNIKDFGEDLFDKTGISFTFQNELDNQDFIFAGGSSRHITLICKEIFTNVVKHAHCQNVQVKVTSPNQHLNISIKDDGCGFEMKGSKKHGFGLENMRSRAKKINGYIDIESKPGLGTEITLRVLIPKKGEDKKKILLDISN